ncbi:hypothetical protein VQH23_04240 [Pararoseomonas sp. SCSIO 73927]|uniref:hypothetical protein n=1 Tax=Pararoseomonas sp. SCSIO 73927 TaxID=3114537 RepID=UPI0030CFA0ED
MTQHRLRAALLPGFLLGLATLLQGGTASATRPELPFHPPASEAEQALDAIIRRADADPDPLSNLLEGRGRRGFRPSVDYAAALTPALLASIRSTERALLRRNCGGRYRPGEICGLDFVPLTCAQDSAETYLYRTQVARPGEAIIAYRPPGESRTPVATYRLLRRGGAWRIDGIRCGEGMPAFNPAAFNPSARRARGGG